MPASSAPALESALARLESRWGSAAIRLGSGQTVQGPPAGGTSLPSGTNQPPRGLNLPSGPSMSTRSMSTPVSGALALAPLPQPEPQPAPAEREVLPTGFARLDALLGLGGLPRGASASFRGGQSSGKTALALHCLAQAQAQGAIVAFLDFAHLLDPLEAASRGVDLRWLVVLRPRDTQEGFALAGALLSGRQVDLLVVDLPARLSAQHENGLRRLAAHARRQAIRLIVLEPVSIGRNLHGALAESVGLRLELEQRAWLRAGRDVVGRCVQVSVAKNRFGPPGRQTELEIRYLADGERQPAVDLLAARSD